MRAALLTLLVAGAVSQAPSADESWRVWGGQRRDFITTSKPLPPPAQKWLAAAPGKLWERPLGTLAGNRLYLRDRSVIMALDLSTVR